MLGEATLHVYTCVHIYVGVYNFYKACIEMCVNNIYKACIHLAGWVGNWDFTALVRHSAAEHAHMLLAQPSLLTVVLEGAAKPGQVI